MTPIPDFLKNYVTEAEKLIADKAIQDIEFSGPTYQIKIHDKNLAQDYWTFLQLDPQGVLQDAFCSCREEEQQEGCAHLAASLIQINKDPAHPLHEKFHYSLWNVICRRFCLHFTDRPKKIKKGKKEIFFAGQLYFTFSTDAAESQFFDLLEKRPQQTEETSLKFSNLSEEEIALWREGKPGEELRYELSFWSDLAKKMMLDQENKKFKGISFSYGAKDLPAEIHVAFDDYSFTYKLQKTDLLPLIPSFGTVDSPLKVFNRLQDFVMSASYNEKTGTLLLEAKPHLQDPRGTVSLDNWTYIPRLGFYPKEVHPLLRTKELKGNQIKEALDQYAQELAPLLKETVLQVHPVQVNYSLNFDASFNLHISAYVINPGELERPYSHSFGEWVYIEKEGFFHLYGLKFATFKKILKSQEVSNFVRNEGGWLNTIEGFHVHLQSLETQIIYHIDRGGRLSFERRVSLESIKQRTNDFGPWIYVENEGFYSKTHVPITLPLQAGVSISPDQIPSFIHHNRAELELVSQFFCSSSPFAQVGLHVSLTELKTIKVIPFFQVKPEFLGKRLNFYDDIVYVEKEGFYELPKEMQLPEKYREIRVFKGADIKTFVQSDLETIRSFITSIDQALIRPLYLQFFAKKIEKMKLGYYVEAVYVTDRGEIPLSALYQAFLQKKPFLFSEMGLVDLESSRFDWLKSIKESQFDFSKNELSLTPVELIRLQALEDVRTEGEGTKTLKQLIDFQTNQPFDLKGLTSVLRPYQQKGVHWLFSLYQFGMSGLLCDDMGLGKTHQAMGLFAALRNLYGKKKTTFLVVCPTSVLYHWQEKLQQFMPNLKVLTFHGTKRKELLGKDYDLLLTSYGILRNEREWFRSLQFTVAVFDEIQVAKNHLSRLYDSLQHIKSAMMLGLTGTPIENRLRELKSLFDIILPFYMPPSGEYNKLYVKPIERENDMQQKNRLSRLIKPFILRRKKKDVLLDLPDKTEEISHCDMHSDQAKLYREVLTQGRERLIPDLANDAKTIPYIHIFALLSRLKQVVDHPALFLKQPQDFKKYHSGKWDLFVELLHEALDSEQKVVIFSQYLGMLDIIEEYLKSHNVGFAGIRGTTKDRSEQIRLFHSDPKCQVFVASLKAGGLGIDLTAGSVVIHYDRWWNKAREDQATDRVHRIGQHRGVQVFKLVTKNTFEERIHQLIEQKGKLLEEVVGVDDHEMLKRFSREELMELLQDYKTSPELD